MRRKFQLMCQLIWGCQEDLTLFLHSIPKFVFDKSGAPFDYSCTTSKTAGRRDLKDSPRRRLKEQDRRALYDKHAKRKITYEAYKDLFYTKVTKSCASCATSSMRDLLANKLLDTKLGFLQKVTEA